MIRLFMSWTAPTDAFGRSDPWFEVAFIFIGTLFVSMTLAGHINDQPSWLIWFIGVGTVESIVKLGRIIISRLDAKADDNQR